MIITWVILCILSATFIYGWCYYDTRDRWIAFASCLPGVLGGPISLLLYFIIFYIMKESIIFKGLKYRSEKT